MTVTEKKVVLSEGDIVGIHGRSDVEGIALVFLLGENEEERIVICTEGAYVEVEGFFRLRRHGRGGKGEPIVRNWWRKLKEAWA